MSSAFFIVGIGGCGRGVCNHIKYDIEQEFGSLEAAKTRILVIDGPERDDVYALPGGYQIDTGQNSPDFYRTETSPANVIKNIATGHADANGKYIAEWLSREDAKLIPSDSTKPDSGFGGHRSPGHAFFYLDAGNIKTRLQNEYNTARRLLGQAEGGSNQVIVVVIGSQSGGTGAGLLFDVLNLMRDIALTNHDMVICFLPLANTYHSLPTSPGQLADHNAQNFAGLLNLMRFMTTDDAFPTIIQYSDMVCSHNGRIADIPFVIDGNVPNAKLNDVPPRLGVVPAIADFMMTIIKDNVRTSAIQPRITDWAQKMIGTAENPEKYAGFGTCSIRFADKELLQTFSYRFTVALYDLILNPKGAELDKGVLLAKSILKQITFLQMVEDPTSPSLEPPAPPKFVPEFKTVGTKIRTGDPGERPFPYPPKKFTEQVDFGRAAVRLGGLRETVDVKNDSQKIKENSITQINRWLVNQHENLVRKFVENLEREMMNIFYVREGVSITPRTLQESPNSIIIACDLLKHLKDKLDHYQDYVSSEYRRTLYPNGPDKNSIIADSFQRLNNAETQMNKKPSSETQQKYLEETQRHFNLEVWDILIRGIQTIVSDLTKRVYDLWNLIGEDTEGWIDTLTEYREFILKLYQGDLARRRAFDDMKLRRYVPSTEGRAEDKLFEEVAVPVLKKLSSQTYWSFAVDPQTPGRYTLLINSPPVPDYDDTQALNDLRSVITGERLKNIQNYNPFKHCKYAINEMKGSLSNKTVWDILELECTEGWCKDLEIAPERRTIDDFIATLAEEFVKRSDVALDYTAASNLIKQDFTICHEPGDLSSVGGRFIAALKNKGCKISSHQDLSKEVRRVNLHFRIPIKQWSYYNQAQNDYVHYVSSPTRRILIDIYTNEQNAARIRKYIEAKIDRTFTQVIETSVTALLNKYTIFQKAALCYIMDLIPLVAGETIVAPKRYALQFKSGQIQLGEEWDVYTLLNSINRLEIKEAANQWRPNKDVQDEILSIWDTFEQTYISGKKLKVLGEELGKKIQAFSLPVPPTGKQDSLDALGKKHLELAIKAVVEEYAEGLK